MFSDSIEIIKVSVTEFIGNGMYIALVLCSILYIFLLEKNENNKILFGFFPLIILFIILNPIFCKCVECVFSESTYWRMFWMIPIGCILAYVCVKIINFEKKLSYQILTATSLTFIIMISGQLIYNNENYITVNNFAKLPDEAVQIAYLLESDDNDYKKVMLSTDLVPYIRQISGNINLAYARNPQGYADDELICQFEQGKVEYIADKCREMECNYIIVNNKIQLTANFLDFDYFLFSQTENYDIYKSI